MLVVSTHNGTASAKALRAMVGISAPTGATSTELIHRGVVIVAGRPESVFARVWHKTMSVVLQESGF